MNLPEERLSKEGQRWEIGCDSCGFTARYEAHKDDSYLLFCGHHFTNNSAKLIELGWNFVERNQEVFEESEETVDA